MDAESPVLPVVASKDPHSLEDAARTALGMRPESNAVSVLLPQLLT